MIVAAVAIFLSLAQAGQASFATPALGEDEARLSELGVDAVDHLAERLRTPKEAPYYDGIIAWLRTNAGRLNRTSAATRALVAFIEHQSRRQDARDQVHAISEAFLALGEFQEDAGIRFLTSWTESAKLGSAHFLGPKSASERAILDFALTGLSRSGTQAAEDVFRKVLASPPHSVRNPRMFRESVHELRSLNREILRRRESKR